LHIITTTVAFSHNTRNIFTIILIKYVLSITQKSIRNQKQSKYFLKNSQMLRITRTFMARIFLYEYCYWILQYSTTKSKHNNFRMTSKTDLKLFYIYKKNKKDEHFDINTGESLLSPRCILNLSFGIQLNDDVYYRIRVFVYHLPVIFHGINLFHLNRKKMFFFCVFKINLFLHL